MRNSSKKFSMNNNNDDNQASKNLKNKNSNI